MTLERIQATIPSGLLASINWGAALTGLAYFFTTVVPAIAGVLSAVWLACQLWLFFKTKPWRKK